MSRANRWLATTGGSAGADYAARFRARAAAGADMHGEARLCAALVAAGARVLDAGCGTGRVAIRLAAEGYDVVGVDLDASMLAEARRAAPELVWVLADLADLDLPADGNDPFDLVVAAGNVLPLMTQGTEHRVLRRLAAALRPGGLLVAGFGLDAAHLPFPVDPADPPLSLGDYDAACAAAGLRLLERWATWDREPYSGGGYAVSLHVRRTP